MRTGDPLGAWQHMVLVLMAKWTRCRLNWPLANFQPRRIIAGF